MERKDLTRLRELLDESASAQITPSIESLYKYLGKTSSLARKLAIPDRIIKTVDDSQRASLRGILSGVMNRGYRGIATFAKSAKSLISEDILCFSSARILKLFLSEESRESHSISQVLDDFLYLDPKVDVDLSNESHVDGEGELYNVAERRRRRRMVYSDAIIFICGGGSYVEFANCKMAACEAASDSRVLYGCSQLLSSESFLSQLFKLAKRGGGEESLT